MKPGGLKQYFTRWVTHQPDGWPCFHDNEHSVTRLLSCDASRTGWVVLGRVPLSGLGIVLQVLLVLHSLIGPGRDLVGTWSGFRTLWFSFLPSDSLRISSRPETSQQMWVLLVGTGFCAAVGFRTSSVRQQMVLSRDVKCCFGSLPWFSALVPPSPPSWAKPDLWRF